MNPGLSAINQTFFMISDGFIVSTNPDPFSIMALKTLKNVLPRWKKWAVQSRVYFADSAYPLPESNMKFIGEIIQRFNLETSMLRVRIKEKFKKLKIISKMDYALNLKKNDMLYDICSLKANGLLKDYCLAEISEFGALIQKANAASVPVFALTRDQLGATGTVLKNMLASQERFDKEFVRIANVVMELVV
ncbi:hypothetical protein OBV_38490 [Oscillibacter valericigenes Sjm18-20]|nr:hypothetical protein OBV_38490 [Oscillibacter valericigenes Sjm18-20]